MTYPRTVSGVPIEAKTLSLTTAEKLFYQSIFSLQTPDLKSKTQILIRGEAKEPKKKVKQTQQANEVNKVKSEHDAKQVTYVEPMGGVVRKRATPGDTVSIYMCIVWRLWR